MHLKEGDQIRITDKDHKKYGKVLTLVSTTTPFGFANDCLFVDEEGIKWCIDVGHTRWELVKRKQKYDGLKADTIYFDEAYFFDDVDKPAHYNQGNIEVIDFIDDQNLGYYEGNVIKYVCRYRYKNGIQDLEKAAWYLNRLIKLKREEERCNS